MAPTEHVVPTPAPVGKRFIMHLFSSRSADLAGRIPPRPDRRGWRRAGLAGQPRRLPLTRMSSVASTLGDFAEGSVLALLGMASAQLPSSASSTKHPIRPGLVCQSSGLQNVHPSCWEAADATPHRSVRSLSLSIGLWRLSPCPHMGFRASCYTTTPYHVPIPE